MKVPDKKINIELRNFQDTPWRDIYHSIWGHIGEILPDGRRVVDLKNFDVINPA